MFPRRATFLWCGAGTGAAPALHAGIAARHRRSPDLAPRHRCGPGVAPAGEALALHAGVGAALAPWRCLWAWVQPRHGRRSPAMCPWELLPVLGPHDGGRARQAQAGVLYPPGGGLLCSQQGTAVTPVTPPATGCGPPCVTARVLARLAGPLGEGTALSPALSGRRAGHRGVGGHRGWCHRLRLGWGGTEQGSVVTSLVVALTRCQPQRGVPHHSVLPQVCSVLRSPPSTSPRMPPCAGTRRRHRRDSRGWAQPPGRRRRRRRNRRAQPYDSVPVPKLILAAPRGQQQPPAPRATGTPVSGGKAPGLGGRRCSLFNFFSPYPDFAFRPGACAPPHPTAPTVLGRCHHLLRAPTAGATGYRPGDNKLAGALQQDFISSASSPSACLPEQDGT